MSLRRAPPVVLAPLIALAAVTPHAPAAVRTNALAVPDLARPVIEVPLQRKGAEPRTGSYGLVVRNRSHVRRRLRIRYASAFARPQYNVRAIARTASITEAGSLTRGTGLVVPVAARDLVDIGIRFVARDRSPPEELRGRLLISSERAGERIPEGLALVIRARGVRSEERSVTVYPKRLTLPVTVFKGRWTGVLPDVIRRDDGEAYVDLRGRGSTALVRRRSEPDVVFRRDDGTSLVVPVKIVRGEPGFARIMIPGTEDPDGRFEHPGRYVGELPLGPGEAAPTVILTANVRVWLGWALAAVLLGVLVGRMVPPLLRLERIRREGRDAVRDALREFRAARAGRPRPASYDLDALISPKRWEQRGGLVRPPHDEPGRLLRALKAGRSEKQLDKTVDDAKTLRVRVECWARMETAARRLLGVLDDPPKGFRGTRPYTDGFDVLSDLQVEPTGAFKTRVQRVGRLTARAERESEVIELSMEVWKLERSLECDVPDLPEEVRHGVDACWAKAGDDHRREVVGYNKLTTRLRSHKETLEEIRDNHPLEAERGLPRAPERLGQVGQDLWATTTEKGRGAAAWPVSVARGLTVQMGAIARGWLGFVEFFSVLLSLAVPLLVYVVTLYDDTWGSWLDFISAFAVGFAGKVALDFGTGGLTLGARQLTESAATKARQAGGTPAVAASNGGGGGAGAEKEDGAAADRSRHRA